MPMPTMARRVAGMTDQRGVAFSFASWLMAGETAPATIQNKMTTGVVRIRLRMLKAGLVLLIKAPAMYPSTNPELNRREKSQVRLQDETSFALHSNPYTILLHSSESEVDDPKNSLF